MTREEVQKELLESTNNSYILELITGFGKTKMALDKTFQLLPNGGKILIVIPKNVLIGFPKPTKKNPNPVPSGWYAEMVKWGYEKYWKYCTFTTYVSLPKHADNWDVVICDEAHHLSERCKEALKSFKIKHFIALSATINRDTKYFLSETYNCKTITTDFKGAIEDEVLPEPTIYLLGMRLDNTKQSCVIFKNKAKQGEPTQMIEFKDRFKVPRGYKKPYKIKCTQQQYYDDISSLIDWYKRKGMHSQIMKTMWLHKAGDRLKWLAEQKIAIVNQLLTKFKNHRTLTFCASIEQADKIKSPSVNSKIGTINLDKFNEGEIKHISSIGMLIEGSNLSNCRINIWQCYNSSETWQKQKLGRGLRHKKPIYIFPYYIDTREEEILNKFLENYNKECIHSIKSIDEIKL